MSNSPQMENHDSILAMLETFRTNVLRRVEALEAKVSPLAARCRDLERKVDDAIVLLRDSTVIFQNSQSVVSSENGDCGSEPRRVCVTFDSSGGSSGVGNFVPRLQNTLLLNSESDYPDGSWLGDEREQFKRVRVPVAPATLFHVNTTCNTPEKMALTLIDLLFDRETQACSNISGLGKHRKRQLNPLFIYGIRCHLQYRFDITSSDWERIKQCIDSKCRTQFLRKMKGIPIEAGGRSAKILKVAAQASGASAGQFSTKNPRSVLLSNIASDCGGQHSKQYHQYQPSHVTCDVMSGHVTPRDTDAAATSGFITVINDNNIDDNNIIPDRATTTSSHVTSSGAIVAPSTATAEVNDGSSGAGGVTEVKILGFVRSTTTEDVNNCCLSGEDGGQMAAALSDCNSEEGGISLHTDDSFDGLIRLQLPKELVLNETDCREYLRVGEEEEEVICTSGDASGSSSVAFIGNSSSSSSVNK